MPSVLFIEEGEYGGDGRYVRVNIPLSIYGAGREKTTLVGVGLKILGKKSDGMVEIGDLTIKGGDTWEKKASGLYAERGMNVIMKGVSVETHNQMGVYANGADISCDDLQVVGCGMSGVYAYTKSTITLSGQGTSIQENGTNGENYHYGLKAHTSSSNIQLVLPLTKEQISTNNGGGGNWGGNGTIKQVSK